MSARPGTETEDDYAAIEWYVRHMRDAFKPGAPVVATEAGYHTQWRKGGVPEEIAALYLPRMLLHQAAMGIERTFIYELMDGGLDDGDTEHHWGLLRHDGTPKPAFHAVAALLAALPAGARPGPLPPVPVLSSDGVRSLAIDTGEGPVLAVWRPVRVWDPARKVRIPVEPASVSVNLPPARRLRTMRLGGPWASHHADTPLQLDAGVTLLRIEA